MPVAFLIAGSTVGFDFFFFCAGTLFEMERTSRMSALVILKTGMADECLVTGD